MPLQHLLLEDLQLVQRGAPDGLEIDAGQGHAAFPPPAVPHWPSRNDKLQDVKKTGLRSVKRNVRNLIRLAAVTCSSGIEHLVGMYRTL